MRTIRVVSFTLAAVAAVFAASSGAVASDPEVRCQSTKYRAAAKKAAADLGCHSKAAKSGGPVDAGCLSKADGKFSDAFAKAEEDVACTEPGSLPAVDALVDAFVDDAVAALPAGTGTTKCASKKRKALAKKIGGLVGAVSKNVKKPDADRLSGSFAKATAKFRKSFAKSEAKTDCTGTGSATELGNRAHALVFALVDPPDPVCPDELLYGAEGNRLRRYDLDTVFDDDVLVEDVLIERASVDPVDGRDVNGMICPLPDGSGGFVMSEDTGQPGTPTGFGVFDATGTQIGKNTGTYPTADPETFGCAFADDGTLFGASIGNQQFGDPNGQLFLFFPPLDEFPGAPASYPNADVSDNFCKLAIDIPTASGLAIGADGAVYVASPRQPAVLRFAPPFPTAPDAGGGCGGTDALGSPLADTTSRETFISDIENLGTPSALAIAPNGNWWVSSVLTGRIAEYDLQGNFVRAILVPEDDDGELPLATGHPQGLAVSCRGDLYYADLALIIDGADIGPGPNGSVRRISFDLSGNPRPPALVRDGLSFPDGLGVLPGDLEAR